GALVWEGETVGSIDETSVHVSNSQSAPMCVINQSFTLTAHSYAESTTGACAGEAVSNIASGTAEKLPSAALFMPHTVRLQPRLGKPESVMVVVENVGLLEATELSASAQPPQLAFAGGAYPGAGGTCEKTLPGGQSCTLALTLDEPKTGPITRLLSLQYHDRQVALSAWSEIVGDVQPDYQNVVHISVGALPNHSGRVCLLDDHTVHCRIPNNLFLSDLPALTKPVVVDVGASQSCAIDTSGLVCWDHGVTGLPTPPPLSNPLAITNGDFHACAIDDTGVVCWGSKTVTPTLSHPIQISACGPDTCAIDDSGVVCWGTSAFVGAVPSLSNAVEVRTGCSGRTSPPPLVGLRAFSLGNSHGCALDDTGVHCWGSNTHGERDVPALIAPTHVAAGANWSCALDQNALICWGSS
ncbi:MAG: hypothetical protein JRH20_28605, partial [Deltaproteobacteria bacterium]|nr:hypothetical protein [Deltaproteobacteria bacterium]